MTLIEVHGDLLNQDVEVIVNPWNRNIIPWWLLLLQGVSGAIKKRAGTQVFKQVAKFGPIPLGQAVKTDAGRLPFKAIIHVAGINMFWITSEKALRACVHSAMDLAKQYGYASIALPMIGAGTGGGSPAQVAQIMREELAKIDYAGEVRLVHFQAR